MKHGILRFAAAILCLCLLCSMLPFGVRGTEDAEETELASAENISSPGLVTSSSGFPSISSLFDGNIYTGFITTSEISSLTLESQTEMGSLYMIFGKVCGEYTLTDPDTGEVRIAGENGFLHEYIDLEALFGYAPNKIRIDFTSGIITLCEIQVYTPGEVPATVQKWVVPQDGNIDLLLFATHDDDPQLFFAGILPYYAGELGYEVLVAYMTNHPGEPNRIHELLNGLWAVGVTNYPVTESFPDFRLQNDRDGTYARYKMLGYSRETLMAYVVKQLRRYKPLVAVGHDINGEYGHGMHIVYTDLLMDAVRISNDPAEYPELAEEYGVWEVPKTYLHLYEKNQIIMDWDQPLEHFGGMTAFEVTKNLGFVCHQSQYAVFAPYHMPYANAADVPTYNPCYYGLYRSTVGADVEKNDFFENLLSRGEQAAQEEAERLQAEEAAREEQERLEAERQEQARLQAEEAEQQEQARLQAEREEASIAALRRRKIVIAVASGGGIVAAFLVFWLIGKRRQEKSK